MVSELPGWIEEPEVDVSRLFLGHEQFAAFSQGLYDEWLRTSNHAAYLRGFNAWQVCILEQEFQEFFFDEQGMVGCYRENDVILKESGNSPEECAVRTWGHESAHKEAARRWKVRSTIRTTWFPDRKIGYFPLPWLQLHMGDLRSLARTNQLFSAMGEILMAPSEAGLGYESEENIAHALLDMARKVEGYNGVSFTPA